LLRFGTLSACPVPILSVLPSKPALLLSTVRPLAPVIASAPLDQLNCPPELARVPTDSDPPERFIVPEPKTCSVPATDINPALTVRVPVPPTPEL